MTILSPVSRLYDIVTNVRNELYDRGQLRSYSLGARTISVGNITAGGTGKTPLVAYIAEALAGRGEKVCILTRGYGRAEPSKRVLVSDGNTVLADARTGGDEPVELARQLLGKAVVIADADRLSAAKWALENFPIDVFILDDGFQHRKAKRDLDLVCIDASRDLAGEELLPAGMLRERLDGLRRVDAIVLTRSNLCPDIDGFVERLSAYIHGSPVFKSWNEVGNVVQLEHYLSNGWAEAAPVATLKAAAFAFCGIGNPGGFFRQLETGVNIVGRKAFRDHHAYTQFDVGRLQLEARKAGAELFLTTAKDAVKLDGVEFEIPCMVVRSDLQIDDPSRFLALITSSS